MPCGVLTSSRPASAAEAPNGLSSTCPAVLQVVSQRRKGTGSPALATRAAATMKALVDRRHRAAAAPQACGGRLNKTAAALHARPRRQQPRPHRERKEPPDSRKCEIEGSRPAQTPARAATRSSRADAMLVFRHGRVAVRGQEHVTASAVQLLTLVGGDAAPGRLVPDVWSAAPEWAIRVAAFVGNAGARLADII